ncbi:MAG: hypothetical protein ACK5P5_04120 [Pseudobdellovibrionaceae bacterium]
MSKLIFGFLTLLMIVPASFAFEAPARSLSGPNSFLGQGLGLSCFAFDLPADSLPCNPAFIAKERERKIRANLNLGNNVTYLKEAMDLSEGRANSDTIQTLFQRRENDELQAKVELGYLQETFGWSVSPFQANYNTSFQNQALPEISLYAAVEETAKIQFGSYMADDWSYGIQLRYIHRRFVASRFFLTDALVPDGNKLFEPKEQHLLFIEPAVLYAPQGNFWNPEFSILAANVGFTHQKYAEVPLVPRYHFTSSITPELTYGRLGLGLDIHYDKYIQRGLEPFTLGSFYEFGILRIFGSLARQEHAAGFGIFNAWWNTGIVHRNERLEDAAGNLYDSKKIYLFLGVEL